VGSSANWSRRTARRNSTRSGSSTLWIVDGALIALYNEDDRREIPDVALDKHTLAGKRRGRGSAHFFDEATLLTDLDTGP
jgi:hypothetical protein